MPNKHICLVTPGYVSANPRLLKEAQTLAANGYQVTVLANANDPVQAARDQRLVSGFVLRAFRPSGAVARKFWRAMQLFAQRVAFLPLPGLRALALSSLAPAMVRAARAVKADFYIGHNLAALTAVAQAARHRRCGFAFDVEDLHVEELIDSKEHAAERQRRRQVEAHWLPQARYVSAAAPLFVDYLRRHYGIEAQVILNAFPLAMAPPNCIEQDDGSLYWVSQTIGPGRGLEEIVEILALTTTRPPLRLRGTPDTAFCAQLCARANALGVRIDLLPNAPAEQMVTLAQNAALGLALEVEDGLNRQLCLTNKVFFYLLGGVPTLFSTTPAQNQFATELGPACVLIDLKAPAVSAQRIDQFLRDPALRAAARRHAFALGQQRFHFEIEAPKLLTLLTAALAQPR
jgi:hypothetical protein